MEALTGWGKYLKSSFLVPSNSPGSRLYSSVKISAIFTFGKIAAKDEWDFEYLGNSNHPFIKANYPHHEGIW
jgi:hypothetical protein